MRKAVVVGLALALVMLFATGAAAHSRFFFGFNVGVPVVRARPVVIPPRVFVTPPVVVVPSAPVVVPGPVFVKRPVWLPGRWVWTAWGWQWLPGQWIGP
jgi:hypothetical protein